MIDRKTFLKRLNLRNFRRFEAITLDLDPGLTLLVAENGGGKTAMLDGVALALSDLNPRERPMASAIRTDAWCGKCAAVGRGHGG
jgi:recombinational DNA repair ATPase RecF